MTICDLSKYDFDLNNIKFEENDMCNIIILTIPRRIDFYIVGMMNIIYVINFTGSKYFNTGFNNIV